MRRVKRSDEDVSRRATRQNRPRTANTSCANLYYVRVLFGAVTGDFDWQLVLEEDGSILVSGNYVIGTTTTFGLQAALSGLTGGPIEVEVTGGPLPVNGLVVHPNRGLSSTRYTFRCTGMNLTPPVGSDLPTYVEVTPCCVIGG